MAINFDKIDNSYCLFLDRDGVINKRIVGGYITKWDDFEFLPHVKESIGILSKYFRRIIVVTNQQGIGKKLMTEAQLDVIHTNLRNEIIEADGVIDAIYYCPELKSSVPNCRKPAGFMAKRAKNDFPEIDFNKSIMIGDTDSDIMFGRMLGMKTVLQKSPELISESADLEIDSMDEFVRLLNTSKL